MQLMMAKTPSNLCVSPLHHNHTAISIKSKNNLNSFKPLTSFFHISSKWYSSCATIQHSTVPNDPNNHKTTDYNAKIRQFCKLGNLKEAMEWLYKCQKTGLESITYCAVLQLCAEHKSLRDGSNVHLIICSNNVVIDSILGSKLVFMYVTSGDLIKGRRVFDEIVNENVFLWNFMINEYAKIGNYKEGINLFYLMRKLGVKVDSYTFTIILKCTGAVKSVQKGKTIHGVLLKLGFDYYNMVANSLIAFYFKCGRVSSAYKVFDELVDKDVISWNSMINGYLTNDRTEQAVNIFIEMLRLGVKFDSATMVSVVSACAHIGSLSLGRVLHGYAIKACFDSEIILTNALIDMYLKCGNLEYAHQVFEKMGSKTVVSWTSMISGYTRKGRSDKAIGLFNDMKSDAVKPDVFVVTSILHACALDGSLENGKNVHNYVKENELQSNMSVSNALVDMYAKCGSMEDAMAVFLTMVKRDIVSWNAIIGGFAKNSLPNEALKMFIKLINEKKPDNVTITCVLPACGSLAALDRGREIHAWILRNDISSDQYVLNALLDMYVKCGTIVLAHLLFQTMPTKDLISWTVMIAGYCMQGLGKEAITAFEEMRRLSIQPSEVSFTSILYACSHSCLVNEARQIFNSMTNEFNMRPKLEHYACMVDVLSNSGNLPDAYQFIKKMPLEPDVKIWGTLLSRCKIHHDVKLAEKVAEKVFELDPENTKYYVLLASIYEEAEKWEEAKKLMARIDRQGLKDNLGYSWIEVNGKVSIFCSGNRHAKQIEKLLTTFRIKMEEELKSPKRHYGWINENEMEKEISSCGHSEKSAMAFGILSCPNGKIIQVNKNLRTCSECHEMGKFMSKNASREIILRDSCRLHHFKNGNCTCRGYW